MNRARPQPSRRLIDHFRPIVAPGADGFAPGLMPTLRAYSGVRVPEARFDRPSETLGRLGSLEVRLARKAAEVRRAQKLRFRVFYQEMSAIADAKSLFARRDIDAFDAVCDHLLVVDRALAGGMVGRRKPPVVGTYRLLRQDVAERHGGFYSAGEFDIDALVAR